MTVLRKIGSLVLFSALLLSNAAAIEFVGPVDQSQGVYQEIFGQQENSGGMDFYFKFQVEEKLDESVYLYRKDASSKSYVEIARVNMDNDYTTSTYYIGNEEVELVIEESNSKVFTVHGAEHIIEFVNVEYEGVNDVTLKIDGEQDVYEPGEPIVLSGNNHKDHILVIVDASHPLADTEIVELVVYGEMDVPEGESSYVLKYGDTGRYSRPIYMSVNYGDETPYLAFTEADQLRVGIFGRTSGVAPVSTIVAKIVQDEGDDYNITLYNAQNDEPLLYYTTNGSQDGVYLHVIKEAIYGVADFFISTESSNTLKFPTGGTGLFPNSGVNEAYYFKIEDIDDRSSRLTAVYNVETSGTNDAPNITEIQGFDGSSWRDITYFDHYADRLEKIRVTVNDSNNQFHGAKLYLEAVGASNVVLDYSTEYNIIDADGGLTRYVWNLNTSINRLGEWKVVANVSDGAKKDSISYNWSVPWPGAVYKHPGANASIADSTPTFNFTTSGPPGTVMLYIDNSSVNNWIHTGSEQNYVYESGSLASGEHQWHVEYVSNKGYHGSARTQSFSIKTNAESFNAAYIDPPDGFTTKSDSISFKYKVSAPAGTVELLLDGSTIDTVNHLGGNATYSYVATDVRKGSHSWKLFYAGQDGSTTYAQTQSFTVVENQAPSVSFTEGADSGPQLKHWILVNVSVTDPSVIQQVVEQFNGVNNSFQTHKGDYYWTNHTGLSKGEYTFKVFASDTNGNTASTSVQSVTIQENEPVSISIIDPDNLTYSSSGVAVDVVTDDPEDLSYSCAVNFNGTKIGVTSDADELFKDTLNIPNGAYNISVDCVDSENAESSSILFFSVNVSETDGGSGGGGGGGPGGFGDVVADLPPQMYGVAPGRTVIKEFVINNLENRRSRVTLSVPASEQCQYFSVKRSNNLSSGFGKTGTYLVAAANSLSGGKAYPSIRIEMPSEAQLSEYENRSIRCVIQASSSLGRVKPLVVEAVPRKGLAAQIEAFLDGLGGGDVFDETGFWLNWLFSGTRGLVLVAVVDLLFVAAGLWIGNRLEK